MILLLILILIINTITTTNNNHYYNTSTDHSSLRLTQEAVQHAKERQFEEEDCVNAELAAHAAPLAAGKEAVDAFFDGVEREAFLTKQQMALLVCDDEDRKEVFEPRYERLLDQLLLEQRQTPGKAHIVRWVTGEYLESDDRLGEEA